MFNKILHVIIEGKCSICGSEVTRCCDCNTPPSETRFAPMHHASPQMHHSPKKCNTRDAKCNTPLRKCITLALYCCICIKKESQPQNIER